MTTTQTPGQPVPCCAHCAGELFDLHDIKRAFGLKETAARDLVDDPSFPRRIVVSSRCHRWLAVEVLSFRESLRDAPLPGPATMGEGSDGLGVTL